MAAWSPCRTPRSTPSRHRRPGSSPTAARLATGADLDLHETYAWGWAEFHRLDQEIRAEAGRVLPGASPLAAMAHLDAKGPAVEGVAEVRGWLQELMDRAVAELDGRHFTIEGPVRRVEAMIAPAGSAAAPYYTRPSLDFSRPGRTWLPTLGETRFPVWNLISTWYHEGAPVTTCSSPGGYSSLAEFVEAGPVDLPDDDRVRVGDDGGLGALRGAADGRARPSDEPGRPVGVAVRPEEPARHLRCPRAWLAGREAARVTRAPEFDLAEWHAKALSLGALGLADLADELSRL